MPPKRKKLGRPPGSKNKKRKTFNKKHLKNDSCSAVTPKKEKATSSPINECVCNVCNKNFKTEKELLKHHRRCRALEYNEMVFSKVNKVYYLTYVYLHSQGMKLISLLINSYFLRIVDKKKLEEFTTNCHTVALPLNSPMKMYEVIHFHFVYRHF